MSNPESFIDEVTEEVRRDKLFATFRKYGWIGILAVLGIVGGTAWTEWQKSQAEAEARAFGDALMMATDASTPEDRRAALAQVQATGEKAAVLNLLIASDPAEDATATLEALNRIEADAALEPLAQPGRSFRVLAAEQLAYLLIEEGKTPEAISALQALTQDQEATGGLRNRAQQMIVALGGEAAQG